ncbi:MAG TPA: hypothetical protein VI977_04530 [archaeon]|nr:hypothetical protein [archaeon]
MGLHAASEMWKPKNTRKSLSIEFDSGEDVILTLKKAMEQYFIKECTITDMEGTMQEAVLAPSKKNLSNLPIMHAKGSYKLDFGEMYGSMEITTKEKQPVTGKLIRGTADKNLQMKISYMEK